MLSNIFNIVNEQMRTMSLLGVFGRICGYVGCNISDIMTFDAKEYIRVKYICWTLQEETEFTGLLEVEGRIRNDNPRSS